MTYTVSTLKHRADFLRLRRGSKAVAPFFVLRVAPIPEDTTRISDIRVGYTVTTKCGNAVVRNRIKRRFRALVRELFTAHAKPGHDYVIIALDGAKPSAAEAEFEALRTAMQCALTRLG